MEVSVQGWHNVDRAIGNSGFTRHVRSSDYAVTLPEGGITAVHHIRDVGTFFFALM